jgi:hypothetical protein
MFFFDANKFEKHTSISRLPRGRYKVSFNFKGVHLNPNSEQTLAVYCQAANSVQRWVYQVIFSYLLHQFFIILCAGSNRVKQCRRATLQGISQFRRNFSCSMKRLILYQSLFFSGNIPENNA